MGILFAQKIRKHEFVSNALQFVLESFAVRFLTDKAFMNDMKEHFYSVISTENEFKSKRYKLP